MITKTLFKINKMIIILFFQISLNYQITQIFSTIFSLLPFDVLLWPQKKDDDKKPSKSRIVSFYQFTSPYLTTPKYSDSGLCNVWIRISPSCTLLITSWELAKHLPDWIARGCPGGPAWPPRWQWRWP